MKVLTCFCLMLILLPGLCFSQNQNTNDAIKGLQKNTLLSIFDTKNAQKHFDDIQTKVNQLIPPQQPTNIPAPSPTISNVESSKPPSRNPGTIEIKGLIEIRKAGPTEKFESLWVRAGGEVWRLLPGKCGKSAFQSLAQSAGKIVVIQGNLMPVDSRHPISAIIVNAVK